jgi:hypothetical protein
MRISSVLLAGSLGANVALLAVIAIGGFSGDAPARPATVVATGAKPAAAKATGADADLWAEVKEGDLPAQVERLQAEGFPPAMVRAIIAAQVRESFAARRKALDGSNDAAYWLPPNRDPNTQAALRALAREEQKILKDLLGSNPENNTATQLRRQVPELPADKIDQLASIRERYDEMRSDLYANIRGTMLPDEREKMNALEKAMHNEFAAVLTPQELESYDMRTSNTASQLRYNLTAFDVTEQEFRALYKLQSAFDEQFNSYNGVANEEQRRARTEGQKALEESIKAALGDQRYADYQRANDYNYRTTSQLVARLELPPATTDQVYALQKDFSDRVSALRSLPPPERAGQLATLATEAEAKLTATLGARGYEAYKQYGGSWLRMLQPPEVRAPGAATATMRLVPGR